MKYWNDDQVLRDLIDGKVKLHVIYASMHSAKTRGYEERYEMFANALAAYDKYRSEQ